jgi:hypothetical protein
MIHIKSLSVERIHGFDVGTVLTGGLIVNAKPVGQTVFGVDFEIYGANNSTGKILATIARPIDTNGMVITLAWDYVGTGMYGIEVRNVPGPLTYGTYYPFANNHVEFSTTADTIEIVQSELGYPSPAAFGTFKNFHGVCTVY